MKQTCECGLVNCRFPKCRYFAIPDDLSIPVFLQRKPKEQVK